MHLFISGWFGPANAGDDAILLTEVKTLLKRLPDAELSILSFDARRTSAMLAGLPRIRRVVRMGRGIGFPLSDFVALLHALRECDVLLIGGGGFLQDLYETRSIPFFWVLARAARSLGKEVAVFGAGVGPIRRRISAIMCRDLADRCGLITVRDQASADVLRGLSVRQRVAVCGDVAFLMEEGGGPSGGLPAGVEAALQKGAAGVVVQGLLPWPGHSIAALVAFLDKVAEEGTGVLFIPFGRYRNRFACCRPDRGIDVEFSERVAGRMSRPSEVLSGVYDLPEILEVMGRCKFLIVMRLHGVVFAALTGVPAVCVTYKRETKVRELMRELGGADFILDAEDLTPELLAGAVRQAKAQDDQARARLADKVEELGMRAARNFELLEEIVIRPGQRRISALGHKKTFRTVRRAGASPQPPGPA